MTKKDIEKTESEKKIESFQALRIHLEPLRINKAEIEGRIKHLRHALQEAEKKFQSVSGEITGMVRDAQELFAEGKALKINPALIAFKGERDTLAEFMDSIQNESLPQEMAALNAVSEEIRRQALIGIAILKNLYKERASQLFSEIKNTWNTYTREADKLILELGISIPGIEQDGIYSDRISEHLFLGKHMGG